MDRTPQTATSKESEEMIKDLICSQEESPGNQTSPREIEKYTRMSHSSMRIIVKKS